MGFSLVGATAIIGVSLIIALEIIIGTTVPTITNVHDSFDKMRNRAIEQVQTDINITSVRTLVNGSDHDINITIDNTGSITLETEDFDILVNGTSYSFTSSKSYLHPKNTVYFNVSSLKGTGIRRLKVITNNGISDYYEFNIT